MALLVVEAGELKPGSASMGRSIARRQSTAGIDPTMAANTVKPPTAATNLKVDFGEFMVLNENGQMIAWQTFLDEVSAMGEKDAQHPELDKTSALAAFVQTRETCKFEAAERKRTAYFAQRGTSNGDGLAGCEAPAATLAQRRGTSSHGLATLGGLRGG
jgi:hypothetical protein